MSSEEETYAGSSSDPPKLLHLSFAPDPNLSLGVQLVNCDDKAGSSDSYMFLPGYAMVGKLLGQDSLAQQQGVRPGDVIVAVNGQGFRRFATDYKIDQVTTVNELPEGIVLDHAVVPSGQGYTSMLAKIKAVKAGEEPVVLSLERYDWDAQAHAWARFLAARDNQVPAAMQMWQLHVAWRSLTFPLNLSPGVQALLEEKTICHVHLGNDTVESSNASNMSIPTVYVDYGKILQLQSAGTVTPDQVVTALVYTTERMLGIAPDPRHPQSCQLIDFTTVTSLTAGLRAETLREIYKVLEPNYPETLQKMVVYPISKLAAKTASTLLSFVNERTQKKFILTNSIETVCSELGWSVEQVDAAGGVPEFVRQHKSHV